MLRWVSGTIFGREVVPEVCRISATSSALGRARARGAAARPSPTSANAPAPPFAIGRQRR